MPGQYKHLARHFGANSAHEVVFITKHKTAEISGVRRITFEVTRAPNEKTHRYLIPAERAVIQGQQLWRTAYALKTSGFVPDIICAHPGWGDALFIKDVFPNTPLLNFCEFYYRARGADVGFDPSESVTDDDLARMRIKNTNNILNLEAMDWGITPTAWQYAVHPKVFQSKLSVLHDGIDVNLCAPNDQAVFRLPSGAAEFRLGDEVITYIARNFEPYRGFGTFMQAAEILLKARPNAHIIAVGADGVSYGKAAPKGTTYRAEWMKKVQLDTSRIHFVGTLPYAQLLTLFQVSAAHLYFTYPFVLSWSMLEAMSCGTPLIASRTAPVMEVIRDNENGLLADFFSPEEVAQQVIRVLEKPALAKLLRSNARASVVRHFNLADALPLHIALIEDLARGMKNPAAASRIAKHYPLTAHQKMIQEMG